MKNVLCCDVSTPKAITATVFRLAFGLSLVLMGLAHYMTIEGYKGLVSSNLGQLEPLGVLWAYILPALLIIGGVCMLLKKYCDIGAWSISLALGSIPVGLLLKAVLGGVSTADLMPMVNSSLIWILVYLIIKHTCCDASHKH